VHFTTQNSRKKISIEDTPYAANAASMVSTTAVTLYEAQENLNFKGSFIAVAGNRNGMRTSKTKSSVLLHGEHERVEHHISTIALRVLPPCGE
jgi:hypothetical protein